MSPRRCPTWPGLGPQLARRLVLPDSFYSPRVASQRGSIRCVHEVRRGEKEMPEFPAITHVALTVASLERSVPWYKDLFGSDPILEEDTGPFQLVAWLTRRPI